MIKLKFRNLILIPLLFLVVLSGCSTFRNTGRQELVGRLITPAASVLRIDLRGKEPAVLSLLEQLLPLEFQEEILPDTDTFIMILYPEDEGGGFVLAALGDYPKKTFNFGLRLNRTWKKKTKPSGYWENADAGYQLSIVSGELMLISQNRMVLALSALSEMGVEPVLAPIDWTALPAAPISMKISRPGLFLPELAAQYPELMKGIEQLGVDISFSEEFVALNGRINFEEPAIAEAAVRPFKFMILAEARASGMALMKKTMTETQIESSGGVLFFTGLPMEAERFQGLAEKMLSGFTGEPSL